MKYNINLTANTLCGEDITELLLPAQELKLTFDSSIYNLSMLHFAARNGNKEIEKKLIAPFEVDISELLSPGVIECNIALVCGTEAVKRWRLQDIIVKDIDHTYTAVPQIEELRGAIKEIYAILKNNNLI